MFEEKAKELGGTYKTNHGMFMERYVIDFPNGYGASIIRGAGSYGGDKGLWELAVTKNGHLCYDTEITDDVLGYLVEEKVLETIEKIAKL